MGSKCHGAEPVPRKSIWQRAREIFLKYMKFVGPGLMISVAYMDPGNYATDVSAGASHKFALLCIVLYSGLIAIFLQSLCIKLGTVTGLDLSRACREYFPRWLNITLYVLSEAAIIATDIAEVIGGAIALNILLKIPLPAGAVITCTDVLLVLLAYTPGTSSMRLVRVFELGVATLVLGVTVCLCIDLAYIPSTTSVAKIFRGFIPSREIFQNNGMYAAVGILGATVMPHSLFLGSGIVQPRLLEYDVQHGHYSMDIDSDDDSSLENKTSRQTKESRFLDYRPSIYAIRYAMKYSIIEVSVALLTFALFINCAILIVSGSALYDTPEAIDADLYTIHHLLSNTLAPAAGTIFMLALLFSGQSAGIVCTIAGQIVCEGHIRWTITPWKRRILTRAIALIPTLAVSTALGKNGLSQALNASQVALSVLLPFLTAPLIYFTCSKRIMSVKVSKPMPDGVPADEEEQTPEYVDMSNGWITSLAAIFIWIFISFLNIYAIVQLGLTSRQT